MKKPYLRIVFFMVLDLRLTKIDCRETIISFLYPLPNSFSRNKCDAMFSPSSCSRVSYRARMFLCAFEMWRNGDRQGRRRVTGRRV